MGRNEIMKAILGLKPGQEARTYDGTQPVIEVRGDRSKWTAEESASFALADAEIEADFLADAHTKDSECTVNPVDDCCTECGIYHGDICQDCGGRGFHEPDCAPEPECECVPTDVDMVDNSSCQVHGVRF